MPRLVRLWKVANSDGAKASLSTLEGGSPNLVLAASEDDENVSVSIDAGEALDLYEALGAWLRDR